MLALTSLPQKNKAVEGKIDCLLGKQSDPWILWCLTIKSDVLYVPHIKEDWSAVLNVNLLYKNRPISKLETSKEKSL